MKKSTNKSQRPFLNRPFSQLSTRPERAWVSVALAF
jgi:hypothetical protein